MPETHGDRVLLPFQQLKPEEMLGHSLPGEASS